MSPARKRKLRNLLFWFCIVAVALVPLAAAGMSPLLAWRSPLYIASGFAGIIGLVLLLGQPLLAGGVMPGLSARRARYMHRLCGFALVLSVIVHVVGLWITSPPDVIDALLFVSPTPFSNWGVVAMWAVFASAVLAALRSGKHMPLSIWRVAHSALAIVIVAGAIIHTLLIEGTMEMYSKVALCIAVFVVTLKIILARRSWAAVFRPKG